MEFQLGILGFKIPILTKKQNLWSDQCPDEIKQNIKKMMKDDTGKMAKSIYELLVDCNQTELSSQQRLSIIESLNPLICTINQILTEEHLDKTELCISHRRKISNVLHSLYNEISYSTKLILENLIEQPRKNKEMIHYAIYYGISYLMEILRTSYLAYVSAPKLLWKDLHIYYQIASQCHLLTKGLKVSDGRLNMHKTIEAAYKHCLLFSIANPFRFRQNEIKCLHLALAEWAPLLIIEKNHSKKALFALDLALDTPPLYINLNKTQPIMGLYLNLNKINSRILEVINKLKIKDKISLTAEETVEFSLSIDMLSLLKSTWCRFGERGQNRVTKKGELRVVLGLANICNAIKKYAMPSDKSSDTADLTLADNEEVINMDVLPGNQLTSPKSFISEFFNCEFINISPSGFCLQWNDGRLHVRAFS